MNPAKVYIKLSPDDKELLIKRIRDGESVSSLSREVKVSRTIIYKWLSASAKPQLSKAGHNLSKKHWRKLSISKERLVIKLWLDNPEYSIRTIAKNAQVSVGGVFNVIKKYQQQARKSGKKVKRYIKRSYIIFDSSQKIDLIKSYYEGKSIAKIAREAGISRTIFYKWLSAEPLLHGADLPAGKAGRNSLALEKRNPRGVNHWRFIPGVRDLILETILENPRLSLSQIAIAIKDKGQNISRSGLYYILKNMQLSSYETRIAYISSRELAAISNDSLSRKKYSLPLGIASALPQFAVFTLFWLIFSILILQLISKPRIFEAPAVQITPSKTQITKEGDKKVTFGDQITAPERSGQDLSWGALAVNSPKDRFKTSENIKLGLGVVDHAGNTICNAEIALEIISPKGEKMFEHGFLNNRVVHSKECSLQSITNKPDYMASISPLNKEGLYSVNIKAKTYEGEREFKHQLLVEKNPLFEIERVSYPTRVFPVSTYPVAITIKANQEFKGVVEDNLPSGILASNISGGGFLFKKAGGQEHIIKWKVNLKKGDVYSVSYNLHFPKIWPEFYEIGPLRFTDSKTGKLIFQEERYWQVVADAVD